MPTSPLKFALAACMAFTFAGTAAQAEFEAKAPFDVVWEAKGTDIRFQIKDAPRGLHQLVLTIDGPRLYQATVVSKEEVPVVNLKEFGKVFDGDYRYEITGATGEKVEVNTTIDANGRETGARDFLMRSVGTSGAFRVRDGVIVMVEDKEEK